MFEPTNSITCRDSFAKLYWEYKTGICHATASVLWITEYELRVVEKKSKVEKNDKKNNST